MKIYKCPSCGASVEAGADAVMLVCSYCGTAMRLDREQFDELNHASGVLRQAKEQERLEALRQAGAAAYGPQHRFWQRVRNLWIVLIVIAALLVSSHSGSVFLTWVEEIAFSLSLFGLCFILPARPRLYLFQDFSDARQQQRFFRKDALWRKEMLAWVLAVGACWAIPEGYAVKAAMNDIGAFLLLFGAVLMYMIRPGKLCRSEASAHKRKR